MEIVDRGTAWLDTGTFRSLMQAAQFVQVIEERQGLRIGCIEEVAYKRGFITSEQLEALARPLLKSGYGEYLLKLLESPMEVLNAHRARIEARLSGLAGFAAGRWALCAHGLPVGPARQAGATSGDAPGLRALRWRSDRALDAALGSSSSTTSP